MKPKQEQFNEYLDRLFPEERAIFGRDGITRTVTFQVTDACNLACTYCYQINKHTNVMKFETAKKFIDYLLDTDPDSPYVNPELSPGIIIEFIGGEPFLEIDLISQITDYFIEQMIIKGHKWATRYRLSICSNGVLYFDEKVQKYIKRHFDQLSFSISIDGNKRLHDACRIFPDGKGSYDIAIAGVKHYQEVLGGVMGSKMTIAPQNVSYLVEAVKNLLELGYDAINLNCVYEKGWTLEHAKIMYYQLKELADYIIDNNYDVYVSMFEDHFFRPMNDEENDNWCGGTGYMLGLDWRGDIYPCIRYMDSSLGDDQPPVIIGNIESGIGLRPEDKNIINYIQSITRRSQSTDECYYCPIAHGCAWCSAYNYQETGDINKRVTYICDMHKSRALANAYYWNKFYIKNNIRKRFKIYIPEDWALTIIDQDEWSMLKDLEERNGIFDEISNKGWYGDRNLIGF